MTPQEILEYNKRCAEFLGWKYNPESSIHFPKGTWTDINCIGHCAEKGLKFHSDWNWIMEVCISLGMEFVTTNKEQLIQAINQFLIWYEQNKTV